MEVLGACYLFIFQAVNYSPSSGRHPSKCPHTPPGPAKNSVGTEEASVPAPLSHNRLSSTNEARVTAIRECVRVSRFQLGSGVEQVSTIPPIVARTAKVEASVEATSLKDYLATGFGYNEGEET